MSTLDVIRWVREEEDAVLRTSDSDEVITIVHLTHDQVSDLADILLRRLFAGLEGGASVVTYWRRDPGSSERLAIHWHLAAPDNDFQPVAGLFHGGRFPIRRR